MANPFKDITMKESRIHTLKSIIAKALTTRPTYVEVENVEDVLPQCCTVQFKHRGFGYVAKMQNNVVVEIARRVNT